MPENEALRFLRRDVAPRLPRELRAPVLVAVRAAAETKGLRPLADLPERSRAELLAALERRVDAHRAPVDPATVVGLTTALAGLPPRGPSARRLAPPAR